MLQTLGDEEDAKVISYLWLKTWIAMSFPEIAEKKVGVSPERGSLVLPSKRDMKKESICEGMLQ